MSEFLIFGSIVHLDRLLPVVHDALGIIERTVQVLPVVTFEHVVLNAIRIPVVGRATQRLYHLTNNNVRP